VEAFMKLNSILYDMEEY